MQKAQTKVEIHGPGHGDTGGLAVGNRSEISFLIGQYGLS